jgi:hypothetical protein
MFALHVSIIICYYVGEVMGDAPYVFALAGMAGENVTFVL